MARIREEIKDLAVTLLSRDVLRNFLLNTAIASILGSGFYANYLLKHPSVGVPQNPSAFRQAAQAVAKPAPKPAAKHAVVHAAPKNQATTTEPAWLKECRLLSKQNSSLKAKYEEEADIGYIRADEAGLLLRALKAEKALRGFMGVPLTAAHILMLSYFEASMGTNQGKAETTTAKGIVQITDGTFIEMLGRYLAGKDADQYKDMFRAFDASLGKEIDYLSWFIKFDSKTSKTTFEEAAYNNAEAKKWFPSKEPLVQRLLKLREGDEGQFISILFAFSDLKRKMPLLEAKLEKAPAAMRIKNLFGDAFLLRMIHNWGFDGTVALLEADPNNRVGTVVKPETARHNGHDPNGTIGGMLVKTAVECSLVFHRLEKDIQDPDLARTAQKARVQERIAKAKAKAEAAKAAKAAQLQSAKKGKKLSQMSPERIQGDGTQRGLAYRRGSEKSPRYQA